MRRSSRSKQLDPNSGLRDRRQIQLYIEREEARKQRAERREVEARVRHSNFELIQRIVLLGLAVVIAIALIVGILGNPALLKLAVVAASALGAIAAGLARWRGRS